MRNLRAAMIAGVAALTAALPVAAQVASTRAPDASKANVSMCIGCHGIPSYHTAFPEVYHVPRIAGQSQAYIVRALQEYRSGERSHPSMLGIARSLSDADMADLAAYYGSNAGVSK